MHNSTIKSDILFFNLIFCCLKMKSVSNMHCRVFSLTITNIVLNTPYNVLNWFHLQTTRKSCWQPDVVGWIQATMQQNTWRWLLKNCTCTQEMIITIKIFLSLNVLPNKSEKETSRYSPQISVYINCSTQNNSPC